MSTASVIVTVVLAAALGLSASVYLAHLKRVVATMDGLGVPRSWLTPLGALKAAGALGLLVGLAVPPVGVAAATGVVLYFIGALTAHARARAFAADDGFPLAVGFLALAVAALALRLATL
jgi:DoxX-like protein